MGKGRERLTASWSANAGPWTEAVRGGLIASRRQATDAAIVGAVLRRAPRRILDVGCGEGWLCRALASTGAEILGIDVSPELIVLAEGGGGASFHCVDYEALVAEPTRLGAGFDTIICNFSLLDDRASALLAALAAVATSDARLLIQTMHPLAVGPPYADGWRTETFAGFAGAAWAPMPWYFRTLASWIALLSPCWTLRTIEEPRLDASPWPASLLLEAGMR